jgi:Flp pilus assembly protein TadB
VHVVHVDDARLAEDVVADVRYGGALRRPLAEHREHLAQEPTARGRIITAMSSEARASAGIQPVVQMTTAATITSAEPIRSPSTSMYAPRTLMLRAAPR